MTQFDTLARVFYNPPRGGAHVHRPGRRENGFLPAVAFVDYHSLDTVEHLDYADRMMVVTFGDTASYQVNGRIEAITRWLVMHSEEIVASDKLQLQFDCTGGTMTPTITRRDPPMHSG